MSNLTQRYLGFVNRHWVDTGFSPVVLLFHLHLSSDKNGKEED
jgi:hypothetical protein